MSKKVLITGGAGFVGANMIRYLLNKYPQYKIINFDCLTTSGTLSRLSAEENNPNYIFVRGDVTVDNDVKYVFDEYRPDFVIHFATQSYIDRNIHQPSIFINTNVIGTQHILINARDTGSEKIVHISTSKVYGNVGQDDAIVEDSRLQPCDPYSASKAASDLFVCAAHNAHQLDVNIIRPTNVYGKYQFPEKLIPTVIEKILSNSEIPINGDGKNFRDWTFIDDYCRAIDLVLHKGNAGEVYNLSSGENWKNIDLVRFIMRKMGVKDKRMTFLKEQPNDLSYGSINSDKIRNELGWTPKTDFETGIEETIKWYQSHSDWLQDVYALKHQKRTPEEI
jgi:dTDP-glucose 4,6-dehydratase